MFPSFDDKLILSGQQLFAGSPASGRVQKWLGSFKEQRHRVREISYFAVGQAVQALRGVFHSHPEPFHVAEHHGDKGREILAAIMSDDCADNRVLQLRLMKIDEKVYAFLPDQLHECVARALGQSSVSPSRPAPVQVPDIHEGEILPAGIVYVHFWVRPLVERVGPTVAQSEFPLSPIRGNREIGWVCATDACNCAGTAVGTEYEDQPATLHRRVLRKQPSCQSTGWLFRMGTTHHEDRTTLFFPLEDVDVAVVCRAANAVAIVAQLLHICDTFAENDRLLEAPTTVEART